MDFRNYKFIELERVFQINDFRANLELAQVRSPGLVHQLQAVVLSEVAQVGYKGCNQQHVPTKRALLALEITYGLGPADIL